MTLIFNHHSLPFDSREQARESIPDFLKFCLGAERLGFTTILMDDSLDAAWFNIKLAADYSWHDWFDQFRDNPEYHEQISAFRSIRTRSPLFQTDGWDDFFDLEAPYSGRSFIALMAAAFYKLPLASFPTRAPWNESPLKVVCFVIDEDEQHIPLDITNWYSFESFSRDKSRLLAERNAGITSAQRIWEDRERLFPALQFCGSTSGQFNNWTGPGNLIPHIRDALQVLNDFTEKWRQRELPDYSHDRLRDFGLTHKVSGESVSVLNHPRKSKEREFCLPSGHKKFFENHIKLPAGYRIHFYPDDATRTIYIGYVGIHLTL